MTWKSILWGLALGAAGAFLWGIVQRRNARFMAVGADEPTLGGELRVKTGYLLGSTDLPDNITGTAGTSSKGGCGCGPALG